MRTVDGGDSPKMTVITVFVAVSNTQAAIVSGFALYLIVLLMRPSKWGNAVELDKYCFNKK